MSTTAFAMLFCGSAIFADDGDRLAKVREGLKPLQRLVGEWNGTASPQDKESKKKRTFWRETSSWGWVISKDRVGMNWKVADGKSIKGGFLTFDPASGDYRMTVETAAGAKGDLVGKLEGTNLELEGTVGGGRMKLSIGVVGENRFLYAISSQPTGKGKWTRDLETGNTRAGVQFAAVNSGPECIVTGGLGTSTVSYKGQNYYVCCSGCKEAFEADPEKYIAEAKKK